MSTQNIQFFYRWRILGVLAVAVAIHFSLFMGIRAIAQEATAQDTAANEPEAVEVATDNEPDVLTIGSVAPPLDVEHWVSDGKGKFAKVTEFEPGHVYVVEFWATWCGPCISSMPHLAETQAAFADDNVQLISISDEDLETVMQFLERPFVPRGQKPAVTDESSDDDDSESAEETPMTYGDLTSAYCLTSDPDRSVHEDYMRAAGQNGIPTCFIVGKSGKVEWIGHPMRMDEPLVEIVNDDWDRDAFGIEFKKNQEAGLLMSKVVGLLRSGKMDAALIAIDEGIDNLADNPRAMSQLKMMRTYALVMPIQKLIADGESEAALDKIDATLPQMDATEHARFLSSITASQLKAGDFDGAAASIRRVIDCDHVSASHMNNLTWSIYEAKLDDDGVPDSVVEAAIAAALCGLESEPENGYLLDTLAHLQYTLGDLDAAIETQTKAIEHYDGNRESLVEFLDELQQEKAATNKD